jgi:hypothetical protein
MDGDSLRGFVDAWSLSPTVAAGVAPAATASSASAAEEADATPLANVADAETAVGKDAAAAEARGAATVAVEVKPMVLSVVLRVRGGRASAAALKTLDLSYDAGDGLFATLTHRSGRDRPLALGSGATAAAALAAALTRTKFCFKLHKTTIETRKIAPAPAYAGAAEHARTSSASSNAATFTIPAVRAAGTMRRRPEASSPPSSPPPPPPPLPRTASVGRRFSDISTAGGGSRAFESSPQSRGSQLPNAPVDHARGFKEQVQMKRQTRVAMSSEVEAVVEVCGRCVLRCIRAVCIRVE